jgi:hypothetical protein
VTRGRKDLCVLRTLLLTLIVMAAALVPGRVHAEDMLILTNDMKSGTLEGCSGGVCKFDGAAIPRASIYYIGLDAELPPPAPQDGTRDEVHLRDGSVHPGPLVSIDATDVVTANAAFERAAVAWIWLTPMAPAGSGGADGTAGSGAAGTAGSSAAADEWPYYQWEGTIRVENRYNDAKHGRHRWQAVYRVKLREENHGGPYLENGHMTNNIGLEPLELDYEFDADQAWLAYPSADMVAKTITMSGHASGQLRGDRLTYTMLGGHLWGLDVPFAEPHQAPADFASLKEVGEYGSAQVAAAEPGWYRLDLRFAEASDAEERARYAGIERGGTLPIYIDPDRDFLNAIPVCMPQPTWVTGRLDRPDQTEVRGGFSYPYRSGDNTAETPNDITVEWSFTRTRL